MYAILLAVVWFGGTAKALETLECYNCSATLARLRQAESCAGDFGTPPRAFNGTRRMIINCTGDHAMCFVRSWRARGRYAWIVQRGCYNATKEDPVLRTLDTPTRSMTCSLRKLAEAEYKVCLCASDWCNFACLHRPCSWLLIFSALRLCHTDLITLVSSALVMLLKVILARN